MVTPLAAVRDRLEAAGIPDAAFEAAQLYMLATGRDARLSGGAPLTAFEQKKLDALCEKRCARFPLQYLCGEWDFLDLTLKVGPGVLIPRADTETVAEAAIEAALHELDSGKYGTILRAKGILPAVDGTWIHFDYVPEECNVRTGSADITGKLCVIGSKLDEAGVAALFGV